MSDYGAWLSVALEAAGEVGTYLRTVWRTDHDITDKGFRDIVTDADIRAETIVLDRLRAAFPDHAITSEEAGADTQDARVRWLVDPIDGTTNFSRNNPNFSTAIAAVEDGMPVVGVVYDSLRDQAFAACAGGGATLNGVPIHVSTTTALTSAIFAIDTPKELELRRRMWRYVGAFLAQGRTMRALGSAALNMAYVASGWVDGYFSVHMKPWDQTAGALLIMEAGGVVSTVSGEPWNPYRPDPFVAATPALLDAMRAAMRGTEDGTP